MKIEDFKLLGTMPDGFDYELYTLGNQIVVMGKNHQNIVGFVIKEGKLKQIEFFAITEGNLKKCGGWSGASGEVEGADECSRNIEITEIN